jgi:hypothetical protein
LIALARRRQYRTGGAGAVAKEGGIPAQPPSRACHGRPGDHGDAWHRRQEVAGANASLLRLPRLPARVTTCHGQPEVALRFLLAIRPARIRAVDGFAGVTSWAVEQSSLLRAPACRRTTRSRGVASFVWPLRESRPLFEASELASQSMSSPPAIIIEGVLVQSQRRAYVVDLCFGKFSPLALAPGAPSLPAGRARRNSTRRETALALRRSRPPATAARQRRANGNSNSDPSDRQSDANPRIDLLARITGGGGLWLRRLRLDDGRPGSPASMGSAASCSIIGDRWAR